MPIPLASGRTWEQDPKGPPVNEPQGISGAIYVRDVNDHSTRAVLKRANARSHRYSIGMERLGYTLGTALGLPVRETYLEPYGGDPASVQLRVEGPSWQTAKRSGWAMVRNVTNATLWPLAVVFDIWMANTDRNSGNVYLEPIPPGAMPPRATASVSWLIDHGQCGLWPGWKLTGVNGDVNNIPEQPSAVGMGRLHAAAENWIRQIMFADLSEAFRTASSTSRQSALDAVKNLDDDAIAKATQEIPSDYISDRQAATLATFLQARRTVVDRVVATYW